MELRVTNVNQAISAGLHWLRVHGVEEPSRNGPVIVSPEPVMTVYTHPWERVLFSPLRDANPFFHLMEALWMLAGRNDVEFPAYFASNIRNYSDDGKTFHGAYGYRWRTAFGGDQLGLLGEELKRNPDTRRAVLQMWSVNNAVNLPSDLWAAQHGKDAPCNTHIYFDCREGKLNMTVLCRSNDIYWGAYGANAVHFSILQEYLAAWVGVPMGVYRQFSNNFHIYTNVVPREKFSALATDAEAHDLYAHSMLSRPPLLNDGETIEQFDEDLKLFFECWDKQVNNFPPNWNTFFFQRVAVPMLLTFVERKNKRPYGDFLKEIVNCDWQVACQQWIERREARKVVTA